MTAPLEFQFPPDPEHLRSLRQHLRSKLNDLGVIGEVADNVVLIIDEIVTNSIEHSDPYRNDGQLVVRLGTDEKDVTLEFEDPDVPGSVVEELARAIESKIEKQPPPDSERGRGLFLIASHIDSLEISQRARGGLLLRGRFRSERA